MRKNERFRKTSRGTGAPIYSTAKRFHNLPDEHTSREPVLHLHMSRREMQLVITPFGVRFDPRPDSFEPPATRKFVVLASVDGQCCDFLAGCQKARGPFTY